MYERLIVAPVELAHNIRIVSTAVILEMPYSYFRERGVDPHACPTDADYKRLEVIALNRLRERLLACKDTDFRDLVRGGLQAGVFEIEPPTEEAPLVG